jgi:hypothetical protein
VSKVRRIGVGLAAGLCALLIGLGLLAWRGQLPAAWRPLQALLPQTPSVTPTRKCQQGTRVLYTNEACPPGTQSLPVSADKVSVLPAVKADAPAPAAASASAPALLRQWAKPDDAAALKDRRMEQVIGR